jgi:hypothetical protein
MEDAEFKRKAEKAFALMAEKGLRKKNRIPFTYRLLWKTGIKIPPALFASFGINVGALGIYFAVFWGFSMWFLVWRHDGFSPLLSIFVVLLAGFFYGLCMAGVFRKRRKACGLPEWEQL